MHLLTFRSSAHIRVIGMTLRWSALGTNGLRRSGWSCDWNICLRRSITWISPADMLCFLTTKNKICNFFISLRQVSHLFPNNPRIWEFNICHNIRTIRDRAFIFHMYIPCDEAFPFIPKLLTLWPWPWPLTYISETLAFAMFLGPLEVGLSYFTGAFLVMMPFCSYQNIVLVVEPVCDI